MENGSPNVYPTEVEQQLCFIRHRNDDIIMGCYGKAFDNGLQAKAAGPKLILFPANQNLGRSGLYHS